MKRRACEAVGTDYDAVETTVPFVFDVGERGEKASAAINQLRWLHAMGAEAVIGWVAGVDRIAPLEGMGPEVIPAAAEMA